MDVERHPIAKTPLDDERRTLIRRRERLTRAFGRAVERRSSFRMRRFCRDLQQANEVLDSIDRIREEFIARGVSEMPQYVVSSLFLEQCFRELTADPSEELFFVTGSEVGGTLVLDQRLTFAQDRRDMLGVTGNVNATHRLLIKLAQFGHRLLAHFHSHPGNGPGSTEPSGKDRNYQGRLEAAGFPTVAAIFSRDGYVRFFRLDHEVEVTIHGTGVERIDGHTFRIAGVCSAQGEGDSRS